MKKSKKKSVKKSSRRPKGNRKPPLLAAAVLCEKVLHEKDDVASIVRIIDTLTITGEDPSLPPGFVALNMFLCFKSGDAKGTRKLTIRQASPLGDTEDIHKQSLDFRGNEQGVHVHCTIPMALKKTGLYWFDVIVNSETMTRIPLRINYHQQEKAATQ